ncbi:tonB-system energizer ExbB [Microvirga rosea]|nr:tonB-system energizer ExbB [Microvirga rosea]MCB8821823.1 tonB-system energizer ExbB [Microvirga rosea]
MVLGILLAGLVAFPGAASAQGTPPAASLAPQTEQAVPATPSAESVPTVSPSEPSRNTPSASASIRIPHDLSPWGMFLAADIVVKAVMLGLAFASLVTWTVWLAKGIELLGAKRRVRQATALLSRAGGLVQAREQVAASSGRKSPVATLIEAAHLEAKASDSLPPEGIKERTAISLSRIEARAGRQMTRGTGVLATIGSTAPFVGLFGTVWGIMNSFIGISQTQTTNLAVVAPGIAEALLATAIGLVAAIPAVVIYNVFARAIAGYRALLSDASADVMRHLSRDLDRRMVSASPVVAFPPASVARTRRAE